MRSLIISLIAFTLLMPALANAQEPSKVPCSFTDLKSSFACVKNIGAASGIQDTNPTTVILTVLRTILTLVAIAGVIAVIIGGGMFMFSMGDPQQAEKGKKTIGWAIAGLLVIGASILIINLVINAFRGPVRQPQQPQRQPGGPPIRDPKPLPFVDPDSKAPPLVDPDKQDK